MSDLDVERTVEVSEPGDHDRFSHIVVPAAAVTEAMVMGTEVTALCGKTWVPSRAPESFPVCATCVERWRQRWGG